MAISHLLLLFPFLAYLFYFLDPEKVVTKIMMNGLKAASESINDNGKEIDKHQVKVEKNPNFLIEPIFIIGNACSRAFNGCC